MTKGFVSVVFVECGGGSSGAGLVKERKMNERINQSINQ